MEALLGLITDNTPQAGETQNQLRRLYDFVEPDQADILIVLGGDGFMLRQLHKVLASHQKIYGINCGRIGFLMNAPALEGLPERIHGAVETYVHPLCMKATTRTGETIVHHAFNEVVMHRETQQAAYISISVDGAPGMSRLICDGVLVATPAGSTAYNLAVNGPVLPFGLDAVALTAISPFRPRRWNGAILRGSSLIRLEAEHMEKRPVSAVADLVRVDHVHAIEITKAYDRAASILFDKDETLDQRIFKEQFLN
ncbi:MAG: NAD kinase [Pseudomonadota bacterium]